MLTIIISLAILDTIILYANCKITKSRNAKTKTATIEYPEISTLHYSPTYGFYYQNSETEYDY